MAKDFNTVKEIITNIAETRTQTSANSKDEVRVAQAMLNDPTFVVDIYNKHGVSGQYSPYTDTRAMIADIIKDTTKISAKEAEELSSTYTFNKNAAQTMINFGKEFVNTYLQTGRKLPLGTRETSNCALIRKHKEAKVNSFPMASAIDADGNKVYTSSPASMTPAYDTIKVSGTCPAHLKNAEKNK